MFITECWQGSVFAYYCRRYSLITLRNAHSVISEAKFGLEAPTSVPFPYWVNISWWYGYYRMCKELWALDVSDTGHLSVQL